MITEGESKSFSKLGLVFSDGVHSKFDLPLIYSFLSKMPVVSQSISNHISFGTDLGSADGIAAIIESFDLVFGLVVPEMHASVCTCCHEPAIVDGIEGNTVDGVEDGVARLLLLVAFEGYYRFLNRFEFTGPKMPFTFLEILEMLALPSKEAMPKVEHLWLMAIDCTCENFPRSVESKMLREFWLLMSMSMIF